MSIENKRAEAVMNAFEAIIRMMENRDRFIAIRDYLLETEPGLIIATIKEGKTIPKYSVDLITILSKLYDTGYTDASIYLEKFK